MNALDLLRSVGGAFAHRLRAALTLLGIVIGTGSIVLLASLIIGGKTLLVDQNQRVSDDDVIVVQTKDVSPDQREKTQRPTTRADKTELGESAALGGAMVAAEKSEWTMAYVGEKKKWVAAVSASDKTLELYRISVVSGRPLSDEDNQTGARVCVIGHAVHDELFAGKPIDASMRVRIGDQLFSVVGALAKKPTMEGSSGPWNWDSKILVPETTFDATWSPDHQVRRIYVRGPSSKEGRAVARSTVQSVLLRRHLGVLNFELKKDESGGTEALIMTVIQVLLLGTGVLALLASGINIMNVMLVTVSERKREIGLRRAIGATPRSIMLQFLLEAATLSLTGGVIGVVAGIGIAWLVALGARASIGRWEFVIPLWSVALGLALAVVTGIVFGLAPAWRAAKVSPIDALRGE